ncbi:MULTISPECIES: DUF262 domain-containing protein [Trichocoleus]|uniref:DUF262 domain-containing protein n=1 Tax=Trichocoleus desertorum GB2-A4 TaxID=2933944 RepID=A0ABV0JDN6_9CYAN|nr:DUF262 domain-containing protein [Trichocoleus sp. FACHB-46]MBD1861298.1 DUF262 domain-containing protein [Trichocoleus sp. FACHB-46]
MKSNIATRLSTDTPFIEDLISGIRRGEIKIPQFQRKFVWKEEQALRLLDSIASNYPVGSLLLWKTPNKLATERNIGEFRLPETDDLTPTDYVLDGQQRITVIYSCFGPEEEDLGFQAAYDLVNEVFIERSLEHKPHVFSLRLLYRTTKLLNFRSGLVSHPDSERLQERLDQIIKVFTSYKVPVVTLKGLSVEEVCPIFERVNSSGTRLSTYDLMVAATWSKTFDLNQESAIISESLTPKGFGDIEGDTVLKCLSAVRNKGIKKEQVLSLRDLEKEDMDKLVIQVKNALLKTVDLLTTEFKIYSWDFLPYEAYAVILCYIFVKRLRLESDDIRRVRQWFWISSFSERYRGASEHFVSKDLEAIDRFVVAADGVIPFGSTPSANELLTLAFRSNNSRTRAFILLLALCGPRNLTNGASIDPSDALSTFNKKQFHHIYPKAYLSRTGSQLDQNALLNICMLTASENNWISDKNPNEYLPALISINRNDIEVIFNSNLMPLPSLVDYSVLAYEEFLKERAKLVEEKIRRLCAGDSI